MLSHLACHAWRAAVLEDKGWEVLTPNIDQEIFLIKKSFCEASHRHSHTPTHSHSKSHSYVFYYLHCSYRRSPPYKYMIKYTAVAVAVAVRGGVAVPVAVPVAGLTKRFFNQKDFLINVWGY